MNVLADTNVILDILLKREPHFTNSYAILNLAVQGKLNVMITVTSITDIYYLLRRSGLDDSSSRNALQQLFSFTQLADVQPDDIQHALISGISDFKDAVAAEVARRKKCRVIITQNIKDFTGSVVPATDPQEFLHTDFPD